MKECGACMKQIPGIRETIKHRAAQCCFGTKDRPEIMKMHNLCKDAAGFKSRDFDMLAEENKKLKPEQLKKKREEYSKALEKDRISFVAVTGMKCTPPKDKDWWSTMKTGMGMEDAAACDDKQIKWMACMKHVKKVPCSFASDFCEAEAPVSKFSSGLAAKDSQGRPMMQLRMLRGSFPCCTSEEECTAIKSGA